MYYSCKFFKGKNNNRQLNLAVECTVSQSLQYKSVFDSKVSSTLSSWKKLISSDFLYGPTNTPDLQKRSRKERPGKVNKNLRLDTLKDQPSATPHSVMTLLPQ